ncbi:DUF5696 domain-containing protein [Paenibacillus eucommiae]|uniref:Uncharacterized protein n=1 Tax=Paenibacillus eucommiae TaxID=1355755 RepID=A0ABS4INF5_9BACL|nr:DUF5696 domain-containing protein [Paenibacillus eucommiae]MBP1989074.1 hypothetical protein [Paenibacillus eucommiae]
MKKRLYGRKPIIAIVILSVVLSSTYFQRDTVVQATEQEMKQESKLETKQETTQETTQETQQANSQLTQHVPEKYEQIAESGHLVLYSNLTTGAIAVKDSRTGYVWKSVVDRKDYDLDKEKALWQNYMSSMVSLTYTSLLSTREQVLSKLYSFSDAKLVGADRMKNGISLNYDFAKIGVGVVLDITLEQGALIVRVPADKIRQKENVGIVSLELMPFFGAEGARVEGYMMYPDGSGALTRYNMKEQRPRDVKGMKLSIYSEDKVSIDEVPIDGESSYQAMLPVFGIKNGDNAVLAASTKGAEDTWINVNPDGYMIGLNRIGFEFNYRHLYSVSMSNITVRGEGSDKSQISRADKELIHSDREVRLFFLSGDEANYSGMANVYRGYLTQQGQLNKVIQDQDEIPLGLDLFMGIYEKRILWDKFIPMTTFKEAEEITSSLKGAGVGQIDLMLKGWTKGGYGKHPVKNGVPESKLGGQSGLKGLAEYVQSNGSRMFLGQDFMLAASKSWGLSSKKDVAKQGSNLPVTNLSNSLVLINPAKAQARSTQFLKQLNKYESSSVALDGMGQSIYHDYNKVNQMDRAQTLQTWQEVMREAVSQRHWIAVDGGNQYVLPYASRLYNIPLNSSKSLISDEDIPFYQMVVHGQIPYSSDPGNLSYDLQFQKLKWVEYGSMPLFELTWQPSSKLNKTTYNTLFTSYYEDWVKQAADIVLEFNQRLHPVWSQPMVLHEQAADKLIKVKYGNGALIYINYNDTAREIEGHLVGALDYLVVEAGDDA